MSASGPSGPLVFYFAKAPIFCLPWPLYIKGKEKLTLPTREEVQLS